MTRGKDFDGMRAGGSEGVQHAGLQAMLEEDVGRDSRLHCFKRTTCGTRFKSKGGFRG
jgi:hypothetical protein